MDARSSLLHPVAACAPTGNPIPFFEALAAGYNEQPDVDATVDLGAFASVSSMSPTMWTSADESIGNALTWASKHPHLTIHLRGIRNSNGPAGRPALRAVRGRRAQCRQYVAEGAGADPVEADAPDSLPFWLSAQGLTPLFLWGRVEAEGASSGVWHGLTQAGDFFKGSPPGRVVVLNLATSSVPIARDIRNGAGGTGCGLGRHGPGHVGYKHFLLDSSQWSGTAAIATMCAGVQGRFWDLHHLLFEDPAAWSHRGVGEALDNFGATCRRPMPPTGTWHRCRPRSRRDAPCSTTWPCCRCLHWQPLTRRPTGSAAPPPAWSSSTCSWPRYRGCARHAHVCDLAPGLRFAGPARRGALPVEQFQSVFEQIFAQLAPSKRRADEFQRQSTALRISLGLFQSGANSSGRFPS